MSRFRILDGGKIPPPPGPPNDPIDPAASIAHLMKIRHEFVASLDELSVRSAIRDLVRSRGPEGAIDFLKRETAFLQELAQTIR